jgi:NitT/TauT family transport system substrate-binding protein
VRHGANPSPILPVPGFSRVNRATALLSLTAFAATPLSVPAAVLPKVIAGFDPIEANANFFAAQSQGYFERSGLIVDLQRTTNGAAGAAAVVSGSFDITIMNVASLASAVQRNLPFVVIALGEMYTAKAPTAQLLVAQNAPMTNARDLQGKTIAVNALNGLAHVAARLWLEQNGAEAGATSFIEMPFALMADALFSARVNAIFVAEPALSAAKRRGARVLANAYDTIGSEFLIGACVSTRAWATQNLETVRRFSSAMHQASIWANHHHDETAVIASAIVNQDVAAIRAQTRATFPEGQLAPALLQPVLDAVTKSGHRSATLSAADIISSAMTT